MHFSHLDTGMMNSSSYSPICFFILRWLLLPFLSALDIFMSYVCTAPGAVSSWFIARLSGTVTRLTRITMMRRIGLCGNQFGLSVLFHRPTLMNTMHFAPLITFSRKIKLEYLEKCLKSFSESEFSFRWGGYVSWCEVTFHSVAEQSVASG